LLLAASLLAALLLAASLLAASAIAASTEARPLAIGGLASDACRAGAASETRACASSDYSRRKPRPAISDAQAAGFGTLILEVNRGFAMELFVLRARDTEPVIQPIRKIARAVPPTGHHWRRRARRVRRDR
jgi:hypothetical protein